MPGALACPRCGEKAPPGSAACSKCGAPFLVIEPTTVRPASQVERFPSPVPSSGTAVRNVALIGSRIGEYQVEALLGEGGMGVVYEGVHPVIGKRVAIKVLRWEIACDPEQMQRLLAEARAVAAVRHRGIVDIFGFGEIGDGRQYIMMELLEGTPLDRIIAKQAPMDVSATLSILEEVLDALDAAHNVGVIHRDLKPSNVFMVAAQRGAHYVKLLDFGLAKQAPIPGGTTPQTRASMLVGTPHYMAPEQAKGQDVGPKTDLYAVGVMAFEMLTGRLPFTGDTPFDVIHFHLTQPPPVPSSLVPGIPPPLDALVVKLLAKSPADRPASAAEVREECFELRRMRTDSRALPPLPPPRAEGRKPVPVGPSTPATLPSPQVLSAATRHPESAPRRGMLSGRTASRLALAAAGVGAVVAGILVGRVAFAPSAPSPAEQPPAIATPPPPVASSPLPAAPVAETPARSFVKLESNARCEAFLGDKSLGWTPLGPYELPAGRHVLRCRNEFGGEAAADVQLDSNATANARFAFESGRLVLLVVPYADVAVDGRKLGVTPIAPVDLIPGKHTVELHMEGKKVVRSVSIERGSAVKLKVNMERER